MNLIVSSNVISVLNISNNISINETSIIKLKNKSISINHFSGESFGILNENNILSIYDLFGNFKSNYQLKSNINCFCFYNDQIIIAGDSQDNIQQYDLSKKSIESTIFTNKIKSQGIISMDISSSRNLLYFCHKNGSISNFNIKNEKNNYLNYNKKVALFDVNHWSDTMLFLGCYCGNLATFDSSTERIINSWDHHKQIITGVSFSTSNKHIGLSISKDRTATIIGCDKNTIIKSIKLTNEPLSCSFGDNFAYAIGDERGVVSLYDFRTNKIIEEFKTEGKVNFVGFNYTDKETDESKKLRAFRDVQNISDYKSLSNNSLFSVGDSGEFKNNENYSLNISELGGFNSSTGASSNNIKKIRKQVNFADNDSDKVKISTPIFSTELQKSKYDKKSNSNMSNLISTAQQKCTISNENVLPDISLRKFITDEIKRELTNFEFRIKNDIIFGIVDQLSITESNILIPITSLIEDNKSLIMENEMLRQELRKYKYNV